MTLLLGVPPAGPIPPDPGEVVARAASRQILAELRELTDVPLIDAPTVPHVGYATQSTRIAGIMLSTKLKSVRRQMLRKLSCQLAINTDACARYLSPTSLDERLREPLS